MSAADGPLPVVTTERPDGQGAFLIVCEHASNHFPEAFGALGLPEAARHAHIAWDPGALALARRLSEALDATLVSAGVSRLVYDLNRPPHAPGAMAAQSEVYEIPGNEGIGPDERLRRTETIYLPFHRALHDTIARRLAQGRRTVMVTVHSFTPVYFGQPRAVELGIIHDADPAFAKAVLAEAQARTALLCRMNEPYSAADGVTHTLRLQATPYGLAHVMLEIRNDLLADDSAVAGVATELAPVLSAALSAMTQTQTEKAAS
ncbi:N-formylglutamate amidohydrolase [Albidovulum sediminicola]|uniref:N-formylglutamate amidohydrolase n=1 Tax=Albidovulum sediminicola TaxID=2984331 RepID=A0ABT2Z748_9RHOB|nr:N-formylglutamate amidohydrolase [Defluviimonas sp. WL0075]MCV2866857.1 N-formylglutamate amidohydrolase [Defluviimonas sp. WL0075]